MELLLYECMLHDVDIVIVIGTLLLMSISSFFHDAMDVLSFHKFDFRYTPSKRHVVECAHKTS